MDIMINLSINDIKKLQCKFDHHLTLQEFISLMLYTLQDTIVNKVEFIHKVTDLFHTIDVNGDGTIEWDEFSSYILATSYCTTELNANLSLKDQVQQKFISSTWKKAYIRQDFTFRDNQTPLCHVKTVIQQFLVIEKQQLLVYFEKKSSIVYINSLHFNVNEAPRYRAAIRTHSSLEDHIVLQLAYIPEKLFLVISSVKENKGYMSLWDIQEPTQPTLYHRYELAYPQDHIIWLPMYQVIITSSRLFPSTLSGTLDKELHRRRRSKRTIISGSRFIGATPLATRMTIHEFLKWDLHSTKHPPPIKFYERLKGVTATIGLPHQFKNPQLAIGEAVGNITIVDGETGSRVQTFSAHGSGVKLLTFSYETNTLGSIGQYAFDDSTSLHVLLWERTALESSFTFKLAIRDIDAPLQSLSLVDSTQQLLVIAYTGELRVYPYKSWNCIQSLQLLPSLHCDGGSRSWSIITHALVNKTVASDAVLLISSGHQDARRSIQFYDWCEVKERQEICFVTYCHPIKSIVAITPCKLLFWDARSGELAKAIDYADVLRHSADPPKNTKSNDGSSDAVAHISAACLDDRERKVIVGDDKGAIKVLNGDSGYVIKEMDPHQAAVISLSYSGMRKQILSISADSVLHICDESQSTGYYIPLGHGNLQSVLLHTLRFSHSINPANQMSTAAQSNGEYSPDLVDPNSRIDYDILYASACNELKLVGVLVGDKNSKNTFVQLWTFEFKHPQGTIVMPDNDEITCFTFFGSSPDIATGSLYGRVLVWAWDQKFTTYTLYMNLVQTSYVDSNEAILHIKAMAVPIVQKPDNAPDSRGSQHSEESVPHDSTGEVSVNNAKEMMTEISKEYDIGQVDPCNFTSTYDIHYYNSIKERIEAEAQYMHVFAISANGRITIWHVNRCTVCELDLKHLQDHTSLDCDSHNKKIYATHDETIINGQVLSVLYGIASKSLLQNPLLVEARSPLLTTKREDMKKRRLYRRGALSDLGYNTIEPIISWISKPDNCVRMSSELFSSANESRKTSTQISQDVGNSQVFEHFTSLSITKDPYTLITANTKGVVKIWSFQGTQLGLLDPFAMRRSLVSYKWIFPTHRNNTDGSGDIITTKKHTQNNDLVTDSQTSPLSQYSTCGNRPKSMSILQKRLIFSPDEKEVMRVKSQNSTSKLSWQDSLLPRPRRDIILCQAYKIAAAYRKSSTSNQVNDLVAHNEAELNRDECTIEINDKRIEIPQTIPTCATAQRSFHRRKKYSMVTLADQFSKAMMGHKRSAVHCDLSQLNVNKNTLSIIDKDIISSVSTSVSSIRPNSVDVSKANTMKANQDLHLIRANKAYSDLRGVGFRESNNLKATKGEMVLEKSHDQHERTLGQSNTNEKSSKLQGRPRPRTSDSAVLRYRLRLSHSWKHAPI